MNLTDLRARLQAGQPTVGGWQQLPCPEAAEIMGRAGYDWVAVDMEHGPIDRHQLPNLFRALEYGGALPFVRVAEASRFNIKAALDAGAKGLILPMIETASQLAEALAFARYPPQGERGVGYCRANNHGGDFDAYLDEAKHTFIAAQIEHIRAVDNLEEILALPGLDAIMVGPYDLSGSLGVTGQLDHPDMEKAMQRIAALAAQRGIPMGCHVVQPNPEELRARIREGYLFLAYGLDTVFLSAAARRPQC